MIIKQGQFSQEQIVKILQQAERQELIVQALCKEHGITFQEMTEVFFDPFFRMIDASRNEEARDAAIGRDSRGRLLTVVHIEIEDESIRVISARKATKTEARPYRRP